MPRYLPTAYADSGALMGAVAFDGHVSVRDWGQEWVVFDGASGDCHLLSAVCGLVFAELLRGPPQGLSPDTLFALAFGDDGDPSDEEMATLNEALTQLQSLGLVRLCGE